MKSKIILLLIFSCIKINAQFDFHCATDCSKILPVKSDKARDVYNVVICYINFADGFLPNGSIPLTDNDLNSVNIESVCRVGYKRVSGQLQRRANKYDYEDAWDRIFASNVEYARGLYTSDRHPDYNDYDHNSVNGYGSFREWADEISNNNITINPYPVPRTGYSGVYAKGIANNIIEYSGRKLIVPIKLPHPRSYYENSDPVEFLERVENDAISKLADMKNNGEINFDINAYKENLNNITILIFSGTIGIAMANGIPGNILIYGEKPAPNSYVHNGEVGGLAFLSGITADAHEFGHCIGWEHTNAGPYCVMNPNGRMNGDSPPHPNIIFKLQKSWISDSNIRKIRTSNQVSDIPPSILDGDCAIVTVYGKPGYNNDWITHSEYIVIENRRRISFDRFIVGLNNIFIPNNFNGGCLIWKYSAHHYFDQNIHPNSWTVKNIKLFTANGFDQFTYNENIESKGSPEHFWGVVVNQAGTIYNVCSGTKTNSSFNIPTGISINSIDGSFTANNYLRFNTEYDYGEPPDYKAVLLNPQDSNAVTLNGTYFHAGLPSRFINILPGSIIDFPSNVLRLVGSAAAPFNIVANGTPENPIIFRGCGYYNGVNNYTCNFEGIQISSRGNAAGFDSTIFRNCIFKNCIDSVYLVIAGNSIPENIPVTIENNIFDDKTGKIWLSTANAGFHIQNICNNINSNIKISTNPDKPFIINGNLQIPAGLSLDIFQQSKLLFTDNGRIVVNGLMNAVGTETQNIILDKTPDANSWIGILLDNGSAELKYCRVNNAGIGIDNYYSQSGSSIENCSFSDNKIFDIRYKLTTFAPSVISNCTFNGNINKKASITGVDAGNLTIENNNFIYESGISLFFNNVFNTLISGNNLQGATSGSTAVGMLFYSSGCNVTCNNITGFNHGMFMDGGSKPILLYNRVWNNSIGLYLKDGSNPVMSPLYSGDNNKADAGYNLIYNNIQEEIFCTVTDSLALSQPLMQNGNNSIFDSLHTGCLISYNGNEVLNIENNYWGSNPQSNNFCGAIDYQPYLISQPSQGNCPGNNTDYKNISNKINPEIPKTYKVYQNYPNPFNPVTNIKYDLPKPGIVSFTIYDILGKEIYNSTFYKEAGGYELIFNGSNLSSGIYFYRIDVQHTGSQAKSYFETKKMLILK